MLPPCVTGSGASDFVTERSALAAGAFTVVVSVSLLLAGFFSHVSLEIVTVFVITVPSAVAALTVAVFVSVAPARAVTCTISVKVADVQGNVGAVAITLPVPPTFGNESVNAGPEFCVNDTNVVPLGMRSVIVTAAAGSGPE